MTLYIILLSLQSFLAITSGGELHQDALLEIDKQGNIKGLPDEFTPAQLDIESYSLRIGNLKSRFPPCIASKIEGHDYEQLTITASWYHSKEILPYYMHISPSSEGRYTSDPLMVNLETLEIVHLFQDTFRDPNTEENDLLLVTTCDQTYMRSIEEVNN